MQISLDKNDSTPNACRRSSMTIEDETRYCIVDHAAKRADSRRAGPSLASLKQARHRRAAASKIPPGDADSSISDDQLSDHSPD